MDLYFSCNCQLYCRKWGVDYTDEPINDAKIVACPFCGVSTSSGEALQEGSIYTFFQCFTCESFAILSQRAKRVTKKEVEKLYPHNAIPDDINFHASKIHEIATIARNPRFFTTENVINGDVIAFYNDFEKFVDENKVNADDFIGISTANKFLKDNELAKKYNIKYSKDAGSSCLALLINDYKLSTPINDCILLNGDVLVTFVDKNNDEIYITVNDLCKK